MANGQVAIYNGTGCPDALPEGEIGQVLTQTAAGEIGWTDANGGNVEVDPACNPALTVMKVGDTFVLCLDLDAAGSYDNTFSGIPVTSVQDALDYIAARAAQSFIKARINSLSPVAVPANTWVNYPPGGFSADVDTTSTMTTANPGYITIPETGRYTLYGAVGTLDLSNTTEAMQVRFTLNGALLGAYPITTGAVIGLSAVAQAILPLHQLSAGDQIGLAIYANKNITVGSGYVAVKKDET